MSQPIPAMIRAAKAQPRPIGPVEGAPLAAELIRRAIAVGADHGLTVRWIGHGAGIIDGQIRSEDAAAFRALAAWCRSVPGRYTVRFADHNTPTGDRTVWRVTVVSGSYSVCLHASMPYGTALVPARELVTA